MTPETKRTAATRFREVARRERLMAAATTLLGQCPIGDITLALVAKRAGIPIGSTCHFYPKLNEQFPATVGRWHRS